MVLSSWNVHSTSVVVPSNWHPPPLPHSFHTVIQPMGQGVDMSLNDIWKREEMRARGRLLDPTLAVHGCFLAVFAESALPLFGGESQWLRGRESKKTGQAGMTLLHNVCCCSMTLWSRSESPLHSPTPRGVCSVCERQRETVLRGWSAVLPMVEQGGLLLIARLSLLIMSLSNQCKRRQEPKWHFSTLMTHVSFVAQLSFAFTHLQSFRTRQFTHLERMVSFIWGTHNGTSVRNLKYVQTFQLVCSVRNWWNPRS